MKKNSPLEEMLVYSVEEVAKIFLLLAIKNVSTGEFVFPFNFLLSVKNKFTVNKKKLELSLLGFDIGCMLLTANILQVTSKINGIKPCHRDYFAISKNKQIMYLGIVYDTYFDIMSIKLLYKDKIFYSQGHGAIVNFDKYFSILK